MALYTQKILAELERTRDLFTSYRERYGNRLSAYIDALEQLSRRYPTSTAIDARQRILRESPASGADVSLGAQPTAEYDAWLRSGGSGMPILPFGQEFANHEEAREWAECIRGITTLAVDGSQLLPWRDASIPVALVQAAIFENPHQPPEPYLKDVVSEVLAPDDLLLTDPDTIDVRTGEVYGTSEKAVHLRRFELETRVLRERMRVLAAIHGVKTAEKTLAFYDGSLLLSFALKMPPAQRDRYVRAMRELLATSRETRVPLVGYIDTSYARDTLTMLRGLADEAARMPEPHGVHDALLWHTRMRWGDRTPAFISCRDDLSRAGYADQQGEVAFVYYQAALNRPPARLEFPRWVLDDGLLDVMIQTLRAETIAGNGYLYPIEAADVAAVISTTDRAQFYALFQEFADREGLPLSFSRKAYSKSYRR